MILLSPLGNALQIALVPVLRRSTLAFTVILDVPEAMPFPNGALSMVGRPAARVLPKLLSLRECYGRFGEIRLAKAWQAYTSLNVLLAATEKLVAQVGRRSEEAIGWTENCEQRAHRIARNFDSSFPSRRPRVSTEGNFAIPSSSSQVCPLIICKYGFAERQSIAPYKMWRWTLEINDPATETLNSTHCARVCPDHHFRRDAIDFSEWPADKAHMKCREWAVCPGPSNLAEERPEARC
uniref:THAP-type domain-containing protein n=1 Tax=Trichuris muris TaxID=70415 RepID=A0A5S6Q6Z7_TRIMR